MRKISVFAVSCAAVLLLSACGSSSSSVPASSGASSAVSSSSEPVSSVSVSSSASVDDAFSDFEAALSENGIAYTEKVRMAAELIGGVNGYKYKTPDYNIEVYTFDPSSDAYLTAEKDGTVIMEGFGSFPAYAHKGMVLMQTDNLPQEVIDRPVETGLLPTTATPAVAIKRSSPLKVSAGTARPTPVSTAWSFCMNILTGISPARRTTARSSSR